ncbi:MAG: glycoside hydrolase family 88 protein [Alistipes senegalensis]|nr:glycoside hydrolase family 88 protein [Bacteroides cellulosilyticus]MCM1352455.1 glycoside hydrolase family 88 protein [Alistipes senegalensis]
MKKTLTFLLACATLVACRHAAPTDGIVDENIRIAVAQLSQLNAASFEQGTPQIPSTYRDGAVVFVPIDDWVSGFFAGNLWYMYRLTGDACWAHDARRHTAILDSVKYLRWHHDVGFMINSSYGNGLLFAPEAGDEEVMVTAARSLASRYVPAARVIQSWNVDRGWQAERGWRCPVIIDNMMNLELLFKATLLSGDSTFYRIAVAHADRTLEEHFREDGSCYHVVDYDPATGAVRRRCTAQGYADESSWARGQAWALYGYTLCYRYTHDDRYLRHAKKVAAMIRHNLPEDLVPYWDYNDPKAPDTYRDASSAAIVASALYELSTYNGNADDKAFADRIVASLSTPAYRAAEDENGGFLLMHSVGSLPHGSSIDVPLNYADYYFLEALLRKRNLETGLPVLN